MIQPGGKTANLGGIARSHPDLATPIGVPMTPVGVVMPIAWAGLSETAHAGWPCAADERKGVSTRTSRRSKPGSMAAGAILFASIVLQAQPTYSSRWWSTGLPVGFRLVAFPWGPAWVVAGGRCRKVGAALILGDVVGAAAILYWVLRSSA